MGWHSPSYYDPYQPSSPRPVHVRVFRQVTRRNNRGAVATHRRLLQYRNGRDIRCEGGVKSRQGWSNDQIKLLSFIRHNHDLTRLESNIEFWWTVSMLQYKILLSNFTGDNLPFQAKT